MGDSYAEGFGVDADERFSSRLERDQREQDRDVSFINGGLTGTGPVQYGRILFNVGLDYDLDGVLICIFANDVRNTKASASPDDLTFVPPQRRGFARFVHAVWPRTATLVKRYRRQQAERRRNEITDFENTVAERALERGVSRERVEDWRNKLPPDLVDAANRGHLVKRVLSQGLLDPDYWNEVLDLASADARARWEATRSVLSHIVQHSRSRGLEVAVVFLPSRLQYDSRSHGHWNPRVALGIHVRPDWLTGPAPIQMQLALWATKVDVPFLDLTSAFRTAAAVQEDLNFPIDGHWAPAGHRVAGDAIADWIESERVFSFVGTGTPDRARAGP